MLHPRERGMLSEAAHFSQNIMAKLQLLVIVLLLHFIAPEKAASELIGLQLKLISGDSPLSPTFLGAINYEQRLETYFNVSKTRVSYLKSCASSNKIMVPSKLICSFKNTGHYFLVQVGIGDPTQYVYLKLDTAISPLTWTLSQGQGNKYDQHKSHTYRKVGPESPICQYPIFRRQNGECTYNISYPDGGYGKGVAAYDQFHFLTRTSTTTYVNKVAFGCTTESKDLHLNPSSGILAMNKSPQSLISQLSSIIRGRFSYCLFLNNKAEGYLRFGNDIIKGKGKVQTVPMVQHLYYPHAYALDLIDISLGNLTLKIHKNVFASTKRNTGFLIDASTIISSIHRDAYIRIRKVLAYRFDKLRLKRITVPNFDLCYEMHPGLKLERVIVPMTFHFRGGAVLKVVPEKLFLLNDKKTRFCLGLMATEGPTVLGAMQQYNVRFTYDIDKRTISFSHEDCVATEKG